MLSYTLSLMQRIIGPYSAAGEEASVVNRCKKSIIHSWRCHSRNKKSHGDLRSTPYLGKWAEGRRVTGHTGRSSEDLSSIAALDRPYLL